MVKFKIRLETHVSLKLCSFQNFQVDWIALYIFKIICVFKFWSNYEKLIFTIIEIVNHTAKCEGFTSGLDRQKTEELKSTSSR